MALFVDTKTVLLQVLSDEREGCGLELIQRAKTRTVGEKILLEGRALSSLYELEVQGLVSSCQCDPAVYGESCPSRYYRLTGKGQRHASVLGLTAEQTF